MSSLNKVMLIGNLGADPEGKYMPSGEMVVNLSIATSERWKDKQTGEQKEKTEWHRVAFFGRIAEVCTEYLRKGSKIYVEGSLQTRKYQKDGVDHYATDIKGRTMTMLDSKGQGGNQNTGGQQSGAGAGTGAPAGDPPAPGPDDFDDDIPF